MKSITRVADLLACFTFETPTLALPQLARAAGASKATMHRYASALVGVGLLAYDEERRVYSVGPECVRLTSVSMRTTSIQEAARPILKRLARTLQHTATLSVWLGDGPVVVLCEPTNMGLIRLEVPVGLRLPPDAAASLIIQAFSERRDQPGAESSPELERIRAQGVASSSNVIDGVRVLAGPVYSGSDLVGAISVVGTVQSLHRDSEQRASELLRVAAAELSYQLGADADVAGR